MQRQRYEGSERHTKPKDRLAEQFNHAVSVSDALDLFQGGIARRDLKCERINRPCIVVAASKTCGDGASQGTEECKRTPEPGKRKVPVRYRGFNTEDGREGVGDLVHDQHADSGEKKRIESAHELSLENE